MNNCLDCSHHVVIRDRDPDPTDWFCDDDVAVTCTLTKNPTIDAQSKYVSNRNEFRSVTCGCRPYRARKESTVPEWCPLKPPKI